MMAKLVARSMVATVAVQVFHLLFGISGCGWDQKLDLLVIVERLPP